MKNRKGSHSSQILTLLGLLFCSVGFSAANPSDENHSSEILVKRLSTTNSSGGAVPKILKVTQNGNKEMVHMSEVVGEPLVILKSDPVKVQSDFRTVDISVLNRQRDKEHAKKVAIVQQDLQSRIKVNEPEPETKPLVKEVSHSESDNSEEQIKKQARVKEDIESRVLPDDGLLGYRQNAGREDKFHYAVKRSDEDYYADEPEPPQQTRVTTEPTKEEDSFFSIFESLFGSSDDESQTKKKSKPESDLTLRNPEDTTIKENIKTVGEILKPLKPLDQPELKTYPGYQSDVSEYRIVNNFHGSQSYGQGFKHREPAPGHHNVYKATEKPFRPYKPHSTNGYEDYDLEEFMDRGEVSTRVKYVSPIITTMTPVRTYPTTTSSTITAAAATPTTTTTTTPTVAATTTAVKTTPKNSHDNKLKFPSIQKKNDFINRNRYQDIKNEATERRAETERVTERTTYQKPEIKTTTKAPHYGEPNHENKKDEVKTQKIQETPNFYNLINLPVRYSTKDTAIPLISTSYANTKIQGMGAHKYEKGANGKYPNHKYDQISTSTTKKPNYWATKRTSTERTTTSFKPSQLISKTTIKYVPGSDFDKAEYDDMPVGLGPEFGGYGSKTDIQAPTRQTLTTISHKELTTKRSDESTPPPPQRPSSERNVVQITELEKTSAKPVKEVYEEYEYETFPDQVQETGLSNAHTNYPPQVNLINSQRRPQKNELEYNNQYQTNGYKTHRPATMTPSNQPSKSQEVVEYEYYDYESDTTTTTTTTPKFKVKYPSLSKDKIKAYGSEKVAVVVPSKDHSFYSESQSYYENTRTSSLTGSTVGSATTTPSTTTITATTSTTSAPLKTPDIPTQTLFNKTESELFTHFKKTTPQYYKPNQFYKEPAPVFEEVNEEESTTKQFTTSTTGKAVTEKGSGETVNPVVGTSLSKDAEGNANIVLVPTKETVKNVDAGDKYSSPDLFSTGSVQKIHQRPAGSMQSAFDYTTEFTVGIIHEGGALSQGPGKTPSGQGHFVASSISTNPYADNEPFRPIPKPPGMSTSFIVVHEEPQRQQPKDPAKFHKHPYPTPPALEETEPIHEPHEFIPSPQFHRPENSKPDIQVRPNSDVDYDFEGIQTEPKPGQYVIFSKPQLNPEVNENQLKRKAESSGLSKTVSNVSHYNEKVIHSGHDSHKHVVFNPKEGQINHSLPKSKPSDKVEQDRHTYGSLPETQDNRLSLELVPPRGTQTEKPFEGNYVVHEKEKKESAVNYPRPHWEKNGKPSFLMNKNDMVDSHYPPLPAQMAPTLIPPSSIPPQRFRRPLQPHMPPLRKNFNEAGINVKPKPNLPNILPQFRPNTKVGSGPYHRPSGHLNSNRRNGVNRFHDKDHGNFPYHIQHPDKDALMHREYEMGPEIIPKFITTRGKLPSESWSSQGMLKRFGQGPLNVDSRSESNLSPNQKILRRHQRTPVTTLQMLKQIPGVKIQKTQVTREEGADSSTLLLPPIYRTYTDQPKSEENVYIVYPAKAPQKLYPDNGKVFIVSDTKSLKNVYNFTKPEDQQHPLLNPYKRGNSFDEKSKNHFPYGFIKPNERSKLNRKEQRETEEDVRKPLKSEESGVVGQSSQQELKITSAEKDEKIDMSLHMQSNNQWNEVKTVPDVMVSSDRNPSVGIRSDHYRFSDSTKKQSEKSEIQLDPPSEYHTSVKEDDSAFTLGAVMHTMPEGNRKGQVTSVSLQDDQKEVNLPKLNVNERISNGKIVTVSMPLDVKQEEKDDLDKYNFQPPFQASSSLNPNEFHVASQGWSIVKNPDEKSHGGNGKETTEMATNAHFNFENFKPELIGGFKPIYELPEEPEKSKQPEREERRLNAR